MHTNALDSFIVRLFYIIIPSTSSLNENLEVLEPVDATTS